MLPEEMEKLIIKMGFEDYRAEQINDWLYQKGIEDFDQMTNLPKQMRNILNKKTYIGKIKNVDKKSSKIDETEKYLYMLEDNSIIESVLMKHPYGNSVCVSSQVGCRMGCKFCASTIGGLVRDLQAWEMLDQILKIRSNLPDSSQVSHVVIMGSGEPLENYDEVIKFIKLINKPEILNISYRRITISTCGLIPAIIKLSKEDLPITLSVSLHAPTDEVRSKIMPINNRYSINPLINACKQYFNKTGRRITFEYILIKNVNDSLNCAIELSDLLKGFPCHVNIIPINTVEGKEFEQPSVENTIRFKKTLADNGINTTIRKEKGTDINGACGQLRYKVMDIKKGNNR